MVRNDAPIGLNGGTVAIAAATNEGAAATMSGGVVRGTSLVGLGALTLSITGYANAKFNGTLNSGLATDDRWVFSQDQTSNLGSFNFGTGFTASQVQLDSGFYEVYGLTAVPEPSTWAAALLAASVIGWSQCRRLLGLASYTVRLCR